MRVWLPRLFSHFISLLKKTTKCPPYLSSWPVSVKERRGKESVLTSVPACFCRSSTVQRSAFGPTGLTEFPQRFTGGIGNLIPVIPALLHPSLYRFPYLLFLYIHTYKRTFQFCHCTNLWYIKYFPFYSLATVRTNQTLWSVSLPTHLE